MSWFELAEFCGQMLAGGVFAGLAVGAFVGTVLFVSRLISKG